VPDTASGSDSVPRVLAFYLPQFHQIPENDAWHGEGFTEWTTVAQSKPLYPGHRQPEIPGELGFYDLRVPETRIAQAVLARSYGISGFLYYHYWFNGRRLLERPLDEVLASGSPDFPFALCWANEGWYRRWQGSKDELILEQEFNEEDDLAHIQWLITCFKDPRYIRVKGRPLLAVYRAQLFPNPKRTVELWRKECEKAGVEPPWLVMFETSDQLGDPAELGFDASSEFVPHLLPTLCDPAAVRPMTDASNMIYDYADVAQGYLRRPRPSWTRYPCVATAWDNSPRRQQGEAQILRGSTPEAYGKWLAEALRQQTAAEKGDGIVFVNAWNEWAEGAHLEPDTHWGRAYLETTKNVLREAGGAESAGSGEVDAVAEAAAGVPTSVETLYEDLYERFVRLQTSASGFISLADRRLKRWKEYYDGRLAEAREETEIIATFNQELEKRLEEQEHRLMELEALRDDASQARSR
jgi:O-antigen biosynthesis protein